MAKIVNEANTQAWFKSLDILQYHLSRIKEANDKMLRGTGSKLQALIDNGDITITDSAVRDKLMNDLGTLNWAEVDVISLKNAADLAETIFKSAVEEPMPTWPEGTE